MNNERRQNRRHDVRAGREADEKQKAGGGVRQCSMVGNLEAPVLYKGADGRQAGLCFFVSVFVE